MQDYKKVPAQSQGRPYCRLFNYIGNCRNPRGSKHLESGDQHHKPTMEVPPGVGGSLETTKVPKNGLPESKIQSRGLNSGSEIEIEFRHTENEQGMWNNELHKDENVKGSNSRNAIEEFLRSRKEAMRRYYTVDHKEK